MSNKSNVQKDQGELTVEEQRKLGIDASGDNKQDKGPLHFDEVFQDFFKGTDKVVKSGKHRRWGIS